MLHICMCILSGFIFEEAMLMTMYMYALYQLYPLQGGYASLHEAAKGGHSTIVKHLLSTPGIDVNIKGKVSWSTE